MDRICIMGIKGNRNFEGVNFIPYFFAVSKSSVPGI